MVYIIMLYATVWSSLIPRHMLFLLQLAKSLEEALGSARAFQITRTSMLCTVNYMLNEFMYDLSVKFSSQM